MASWRPALVRIGRACSLRRARMAAADGRTRRPGGVERLALHALRARYHSAAQGSARMRVALINPHWQFDGSIYFGCREEHLPIELGRSAQMLEASGHVARVIDAHMFKLSNSDIVAELRSFRPEM